MEHVINTGNSEGWSARLSAPTRALAGDELVGRRAAPLKGRARPCSRPASSTFRRAQISARPVPAREHLQCAVARRLCCRDDDDRGAAPFRRTHSARGLEAARLLPHRSSGDAIASPARRRRWAGSDLWVATLNGYAAARRRAALGATRCRLRAPRPPACTSDIVDLATRFDRRRAIEYLSGRLPHRSSSPAPAPVDLAGGSSSAAISSLSDRASARLAAAGRGWGRDRGSPSS